MPKPNFFVSVIAAFFISITTANAQTKIITVEPTLEQKPEVLEPETPAYSDQDIAIVQGLKKVTAEISTIRVPLNTPTQFGTLIITAKKCVKSAPENRPENIGLLLIEDAPLNEEKTTVFSGWMFSSSPAISALEHPVYDITMRECTTLNKKNTGAKKEEKPEEN